MSLTASITRCKPDESAHCTGVCGVHPRCPMPSYFTRVVSFCVEPCYTGRHCPPLFPSSDIDIRANTVRRLPEEGTPFPHSSQQVISRNNLGASLRGTRSSLRLHTTQRRRKIGRDASIELLCLQCFFFLYNPSPLFFIQSNYEISKCVCGASPATFWWRCQKTAAVLCHSHSTLRKVEGSEEIWQRNASKGKNLSFSEAAEGTIWALTINE